MTDKISKKELDKIRASFNPKHTRAKFLQAGVPSKQVDMLIAVDEQLFAMNDEDLEMEVLSAREQGIDI